MKWIRRVVRHVDIPGVWRVINHDQKFAECEPVDTEAKGFALLGLCGTLWFKKQDLQEDTQKETLL